MADPIDDLAIRFGSLEGIPVRFNITEAWWFPNGAWVEINAAEPWVTAALLSECEFEKQFGKVQPLPSKAFQA